MYVMLPVMDRLSNKISYPKNVFAGKHYCPLNVYEKLNRQLDIYFSRCHFFP
jgi:hypothetical protein